MATVVQLLCAVLILVLSFVILWKSLLFNKKRRLLLPPLAEGALPIIGHTLIGLCSRERLYEVATKRVLAASLKKGNELVTVRCGFWNFYVFMNPDDGDLLVSSCLKKDYIYGLFKPLLGKEGLLTADVPIWQRHRKLINPTFNQVVLDTYLVEFNNLSRQLVKNLAQEVGKGSFDHIPYMKHAIIQVVCATIMGVNVDDDDIIVKLSKYTEIFTNCMIKRMRTVYYQNRYLFSLSNLKKTQNEAARTLQEITFEIVRKKKAKLAAQGDKLKDATKPRFKAFIDLLLELSQNGSLTESEVREEVNTFIGTGFDTTSYALGVTLLVLGSYPEVQRKVHEELQEVFEGSDRDVERQDMSKLKYLEAVVKETLRLYPVIFAVGRTLDKEMSFKNYTLPAGSRCFTIIYSIGRHPVWGPDAEQFRPERWLDGSLPSNLKAYAVFSLGKRHCIGSQYAMMLIKTALSHVLRHYRVYGDVTQLVQNIDIVVSPISGHHISIERRE